MGPAEEVKPIKLDPVEEPESNFFTDRRLGLFTLDRGLMDDSPETLMKALESFLIVRCELIEYGNFFQYHAYSPRFEKLEFGQMIPEYSILLDNDGSIIGVEKI